MMIRVAKFHGVNLQIVYPVSGTIVARSSFSRQFVGVRCDNDSSLTVNPFNKLTRRATAGQASLHAENQELSIHFTLFIGCVDFLTVNEKDAAGIGQFLQSARIPYQASACRAQSGRPSRRAAAACRMSSSGLMKEQSEYFLVWI